MVGHPKTKESASTVGKAFPGLCPVLSWNIQIQDLGVLTPALVILFFYQFRVGKMNQTQQKLPNLKLTFLLKMNPLKSMISRNPLKDQISIAKENLLTKLSK